MELDVSEGLPPVDGNAILLEWALENLIKNALDALAGAGGKIVIEAYSPSDNSVEIRVADNGPGVNPSVRTTIFDPGVSTKKGGWGVGLSLARRIVEDVHGGRLYLALVEKGATFVMVLPAAERPAHPEPEKGPGLGLAARMGLPWAAGARAATGDEAADATASPEDEAPRTDPGPRVSKAD
jgi:signal transduction histidine kinase